jgi:hypothetical protein
MIIPISALVPPCFVMNRGKRKKALKLDTVKRFAPASMINDGLYNFEGVLSGIFELTEGVIFM